MSPLRTVRLIARRDFMERLRSRAFQISTGISLLLVVGVVVAPTFFGDVAGLTATVGVVGEDPADLVAALEEIAPPGATIDGVTFPDEAAARTALEDGTVDLVVTDGAVLATSETPSSFLAAATSIVAAQRVAERATELGLTPQEAADLLSAADVPVERIGGDGAPDLAAQGIAFFASVIMFIAIVTYGQWILLGVVEEKANRVVELVLGAVLPRRLLAGKIIGIGALGILQLLVVGVVGFGAAIAVGATGVPTVIGTIAGSVILWFLLGYALYATAYAAAGSLVSRTEEAQNAAFPLTMIVMIPYLIAVTALTGGSDLLRYVSYVPIWSPIAMPVRMAAGDAAPWEVAFTLVMTMATIYVFVRIGGRIYEANILRTGAKGSLRVALRSLPARPSPRRPRDR